MFSWVVIATALAGARPMDVKTLKEDLVKAHGEQARPRIERGIDQVASLWRKEDGDLSAFVKESFISKPQDLDATFARFESNFEAIDGHYLEINRELKKQQDLDLGEVLPADKLFGAFDPTAHLADDFFGNKLAFIALLNWPLTTLKERVEQGKGWSRQQWAEARLTGRFSRRVPADIAKEIPGAGAAASLYIDEYNIWMHHLLDDKGVRLFPLGKRLITHWNLRDELKADYAEPRGLDMQRMIIKVMERIVTQTIPAAVIDNPNVDWNPYSNKVTVTPAAELEKDAPKKSTDTSGKAEPDTR